jgi:hypothetical protein
MGRPFLYSLTYGEEGVVHAIESMFLSNFLSCYTLSSSFFYFFSIDNQYTESDYMKIRADDSYER